MKFAVIGCDDEIRRIAQYLATSTQHRIVRFYDSDSRASQLTNLFPESTGTGDWHDVIENPEFDAVIFGIRPRIGESIDRRAEQLRKLLEAQTPLILLHPVCESIHAIEAEMIRRDTQGVIVPFLPELHHPEFQEFARRIAGMRQVEQVIFERFLEDRDNEHVLNRFSQDAVLIQELVGPLKQIGAMGGNSENPNYANLAVNMTSSSERMVRWSISPMGEFAGARITVLGDGQNLSFLAPDDFAFRTSPPVDAAHTSESWSYEKSCNLIFKKLEDQMLEKPESDDWLKACHAIEVTDAVEQSCRRRRTIEILGEHPTEEDTFKAMMTAGGCGMLLWVLMLLPLEGMIPRENRVLRTVWYVLFLVPLILFLGLQFLKLLFRNSENKNQVE